MLLVMRASRKKFSAGAIIYYRSTISENEPKKKAYHDTDRPTSTGNLITLTAYQQTPFLCTTSLRVATHPNHSSTEMMIPFSGSLAKATLLSGAPDVLEIRVLDTEARTIPHLLTGSSL